MSFTAQNLKSHLSKFYPRVIRDRGRAIFYDDRVEDLEIEEDFFSADVIGSNGNLYEVSFSYISSQIGFSASCDCPHESFCKHEAALAYTVIAMLSKNPKKRKVKVAKNKFSNLSADEFRKLEIIKQDLISAIEYYSYNSHNRLYWGEEVVMTIVDDLHIEIYTENKSYSYLNDIKNHICLKLENGEVWVKCKKCRKKTSLFCEHQNVVLNYVGSTLRQAGIGLKEFSIPEARRRAAATYEIAPEVFDKYYVLSFGMRGFEVVGKENVVGLPWVENTNYQLNQNLRNKKEEVEIEFEKQLEGRRPKYAYIWNANEDGYPRLLFMAGFGLKTKEGIHAASRSVLSSPQILPVSQREVALRLKLLEGNTDMEEVFKIASEVISDNTDLINEVYNYNLEQRYFSDEIANRDLHLFTFDSNILECRLYCEYRENHVHLTRQLSIQGTPLAYDKVSRHNMLFSLIEGRGYLHPNSLYSDLMNQFGGHDTIMFRYSGEEEIVQFIDRLKSSFEIIFKNDFLPKEVILKRPEFQIYLEEMGTYVLIRPKIKYGDHVFEVLTDNFIYEGKNKLKPDSADVSFFRDFIRKSHPDFEKISFFQGFVFLEARELLNNFWFMHFVNSCESLNITVFGQKDLKNYRYSTKKVVISTHVNSGIKWFDVAVDVSFGKEKVKNADWIKAVKNNQTYVTLKDGSLGMLPEDWLTNIKKILKVSDVEKGDLSISKYRFNVIDELFPEDLDDAIKEEIQEKKKRLLEYDFGKKYRIPTSIKADLRDYQKHGYQWLRFLDNNEMGGILADDMGLGKTLQVISLLASQKKLGVSLVVVPRTLLYNWGAELDKFCPTLNYYIHHGTGRLAMIEDYNKPNVIISTYGTVASDIEKLKEYKFNYIVLDESQAIKNPNSQRYKAIKLLQSRAVLAMTGTPIENNTMDLYAQFNVTSPGLLGSQSSFKKNFAVPIDNHGDRAAADLLRKMIYPFILRRTKEQVAKDLPSKSESIIYCEMGKAQRKLYETLREQIKKDVHSKVEEDGLAQSKFFMLDGLLRLRQMCNSPLLVNSNFQGANAESAKIKVLIQNITENLENHSALVFSQFVSLLSIVRAELDKLKIPYAYLDGSTRNRKKVVEEYMQNDHIKIFLISIKAGNTGMNLTKADYVYILDPWWNPAVEAQAIDRTHRIGQDKNVFAYKLICKDSIEEKILKLQERKKDLAKDLIQVDENVIKSLDKQRLLELFD